MKWADDYATSSVLTIGLGSFVPFHLSAVSRTASLVFPQASWTFPSACFAVPSD